MGAGAGIPPQANMSLDLAGPDFGYGEPKAICRDSSLNFANKRIRCPILSIPIDISSLSSMGMLERIYSNISSVSSYPASHNN